MSVPQPSSSRRPAESRTVWQRLTEPVVRDDVVARASQYLEISEYEFMALAYWHWSGVIAPREKIDRLFRVYFRDEERVPRWAHELASEIVEKGDAGTLVPEEYGVRAPRPKVEHLFYMVRDTTITLVALGLFLYGMHLTWGI